jgi:hypothetical protein
VNAESASNETTEQKIARLEVRLSSTLDAAKRHRINDEINRLKGLLVAAEFEREVAAPNRAVKYRDLGPGEEPQPGDLAVHRYLDLDARTVARYNVVGVWLDLGLDSPSGPFPGDQYTYRRPVAADPLFIPHKASLPYNGKSKVGHSEAGAEQQAKDDADGGATSARQQATLAWLERQERDGSTIAELSLAKNWHHGQASGALSVLNKTGDIVRLKHRRKGQSIYVLPQHIDGRDVAAQRQNPNVVVVGEPEIRYVEKPVPTPVALSDSDVAFVNFIGERTANAANAGALQVPFRPATIERLMGIIATLRGIDG